MGSLAHTPTPLEPLCVLSKVPVFSLPFWICQFSVEIGEGLIVPILWHFGKLNFTYYGTLRQPECLYSGCWSINFWRCLPLHLTIGSLFSRAYEKYETLSLCFVGKGKGKLWIKLCFIYVRTLTSLWSRYCLLLLRWLKACCSRELSRL